MFARTPDPVTARVRARARRVVIGGALLAAFACRAASPAVTLPEATRLAVERAPLLDARRAQLESARQETRRADALPDPMLTFGIDNLPVTGSDAFDPATDFMTMKKIGVRQQIPARAKREARRLLASRASDQARAETVATRLAVRRAAAEAWIDLWAAQRELETLAALRAQAETAARTAKAKVSGGTASATDAMAAQAAVIELDNRIEAAKVTQAAAQAELARWLGEPAPQVSREAPDFAIVPIAEAQLLANLDRLGPLLPATTQVETAAAAVDLARADKHPDWSVAASYGQRAGGRSDMLMLEVGIGLPLFPGNRQDRGVAAREADYQAALSIRDDRRREQAAQIRAGFARWEGLRRQIALHEDALLPLAADRSATALAAYRAGGDISAWLDARRDELDAHLAHVEHLDALGRAWAALAFLLPTETRP